MSRLKKQRAHLLVCTHKTCLKRGAKLVAKELKAALKREGLRAAVMLSEVDCLDQCGRGPVVVAYPDGVWYEEVDEECARAIVKQHLAEGHAVTKHVMHDLRS